MTCEETLARLDDLLDGALTAEESAAVRAHLAGCAACAAEHRGLVRVLRAAAELPREIEPPAELWATIRKRIDAGARAPVAQSSRTYRNWALAATAAAAVLGAALIGVVVRDAGQAPAEVATVPAEPAASPTPASAVPAYNELAAVRDHLLGELERRESQLDPDTVREVRENLAIMDRAADDIRAALDREPENGSLQKLLLASYRKQVDLLRIVARLPHEAGGERS